jgi:hypothetical protein
MVTNEPSEIEPESGALGAVRSEDRSWLATRHAVDEGLAVREHARPLDVDEELFVAIRRCQIVGLGRGQSPLGPQIGRVLVRVGAGA